MQLAAGQNMTLPDTPGVRVSLRWAAQAPVDADLSALLLRDGTVLSDDHFVFYNQVASPDGSVTHVGKHTDGSGVTDAVDVDLAGVPQEVEVVVLAVSAHPAAPGALARLGEPEVHVLDGRGQLLASHRLSRLTTESAVDVVELYRRGGAWKLRAVGQGWADGLAGLARDFGVDVGDEDVPGSEAAAAPAVDWSDPPVPAGYELQG